MARFFAAYIISGVTPGRSAFLRVVSTTTPFFFTTTLLRTSVRVVWWYEEDVSLFDAPSVADAVFAFAASASASASAEDFARPVDA